LLDSARNNFLCAVQVAADGRVGVAAADLSTGEFRIITVEARDADAVLARLAPREILVPDLSGAASDAGAQALEALIGPSGALVAARAAWEFDTDRAQD